MLLSDFLHAQSTHGLLYDLFSSEIGLRSVSHPTVQVEALMQAFADLKARALQGVRGEFTMDFYHPSGESAGRATISGKDEALLFSSVYGPMNGFLNTAGPGFEVSLLNLVVYPCLGPVVMSNPGFHAAVLQQLTAHCQRYGSPVTQRIVRALPCFGLSALVKPLEDKVATAEAAA